MFFDLTGSFEIWVSGISKVDYIFPCNYIKVPVYMSRGGNTVLKVVLFQFILDKTYGERWPFQGMKL